MERFEPLDRTGARAAVGDEELWEWAKCGAPPPPSTLDLEPATCHTSVSALDPARSDEEGEVVLPDFYRSQFTPEIRDKLLAAVRSVSARAVQNIEASCNAKQCICFDAKVLDCYGCVRSTDQDMAGIGPWCPECRAGQAFELSASGSCGVSRTHVLSLFVLSISGRHALDCLALHR